MATLSIQTVVEAGITPSFAAVAAGGDVATNTGREMIYLVNSSGSNSYTVTVTAQNASATKPGFGTMTKSNAAVSVGTSARKMIGPFPVGAFNNTTGQIAITYTGSAPATDLTIAVVRIPVVE
jgi:hypothetical protein